MKYRKLLLLTAILLLMVTVTGCKSKKNYENAVAWMDKGSYINAYWGFAELGSYKDSEDLAAQCKEAVLQDPELLTSDISNTYRHVISPAELAYYVLSNGTPVICESWAGGYYDDDSHVMDIKENEKSYWYDPLSKKTMSSGEVGFQKVTTSFDLFAGDLAVGITQSIFYGTSPGDAGNTVTATLYYQTHPIHANYLDITRFMGDAKTGSTYFFEIPYVDRQVLTAAFLCVIDGNQIKILSYAGYVELDLEESTANSEAASDRNGEWKTVEINSDNWQEYFELKVDEYASLRKNHLT